MSLMVMSRLPPLRKAASMAGRFCAGSDRKSTRLNSSHLVISYAVFCLKKKDVVWQPRYVVILPVSVNLRDAGSKSSAAAFFFNDTATTEIYTLSLHDALPI